MNRDPSQSSRRRFIKISTAALAAAPLANVLFSGAAQGQILRAAKTALAGYKPPTA